jgi:hypothetical protein
VDLPDSLSEPVVRDAYQAGWLAGQGDAGAAERLVLAGARAEVVAATESDVDNRRAQAGARARSDLVLTDLRWRAQGYLDGLSAAERAFQLMVAATPWRGRLRGLPPVEARRRHG